MCGVRAREGVHNPYTLTAGGPAELCAFLATLADCVEPLVLVIDDYHLITTPVIHTSVALPEALRYQFTTEGVTMRWGGFTHHEISLAYSRIQDIHVRSNLIERWFGLTRICIRYPGSGR